MERNQGKLFIKTSLVQLVERRFPKPDVVGSSPTGRASFFYCKSHSKRHLGLLSSSFLFFFRQIIPALSVPPL